MADYLPSYSSQKGTTFLFVDNELIVFVLTNLFVSS